jgi:hypothetical protein
MGRASSFTDDSDSGDIGLPLGLKPFIAGRIDVRLS